MCLRNTKIEVKTAEEDIVCYKIVKKNMMSLFQRFPYEFGKEYSLDKSFSISGPQVEVCLTTDEDNNLIEDFVTVEFINEGFHSYVDIERASHAMAYQKWISGRNILLIKMVKCMIPKGSKYCTGGDIAGVYDNCYVSDRIIIKEDVAIGEYYKYVEM